MSVSAAPAALLIDAERPFDAPAIERVTLAAFGPGRFAKTAERLRERAPLAAGFVAREEGRVIGSVRLWSITVGGVPALFLGPIAVEASSRRAGTGAALVQACIDHARSVSDIAGVLLIGDPPYFARFGFRLAPNVRLPGPADARRMMWLPVRQDEIEGAAT